MSSSSRQTPASLVSNHFTAAPPGYSPPYNPNPPERPSQMRSPTPPVQHADAATQTVEVTGDDTVLVSKANPAQILHLVKGDPQNLDMCRGFEYFKAGLVAYPDRLSFLLGKNQTVKTVQEAVAMMGAVRDLLVDVRDKLGRVVFNRAKLAEQLPHERVLAAEIMQTIKQREYDAVVRVAWLHTHLELTSGLLCRDSA